MTICPGCGAVVPPKRHGGGRPKRWCSGECRARTGSLPRDRGNPATSDREYSDEEREWLAALDHWKMSHHNQFPTACDVLALAKGLGYRKG